MRQEALRKVYELAKKDSRVVFVGSDLATGTLQAMKKELPNQFFMEGISEQHLIGFAAGLAKEGYIPFLNTIANFFTRRALEQIILDVCLHKLPVKILASGGGMVYAPLGPTHTAVDDLAHMLAIPNLNVYAPCDAVDMTNLLSQEVQTEMPAYIRFGKGGEEIVSDKLTRSKDSTFSFVGNFKAKRVVITTGVGVQPAISAIRNLFDESSSLFIHALRLNYFSAEFVEILSNKERVVVVEEHQSYGGLYTKLLHFCHQNNIDSRSIVSISLGNEFVRRYGSQSDHFAAYGITAERIMEELVK